MWCLYVDIELGLVDRVWQVNRASEGMVQRSITAQDDRPKRERAKHRL